MYADDTTLVGNLSNFDNKNGNDCYTNITIKLALLNDWLKLNKLSLNEKKTKCMIMFYSQQREVPFIKLSMNITDLEPITDFNFLFWHPWGNIKRLTCKVTLTKLVNISCAIMLQTRSLLNP